MWCVCKSKIEEEKMICLNYSICYKMFQAEIFFFPQLYGVYMASDPYRAEWKRHSVCSAMYRDTLWSVQHSTVQLYVLCMRVHDQEPYCTYCTVSTNSAWAGPESGCLGQIPRRDSTRVIGEKRLIQNWKPVGLDYTLNIPEPVKFFAW